LEAEENDGNEETTCHQNNQAAVKRQQRSRRTVTKPPDVQPARPSAVTREKSYSNTASKDFHLSYIGRDDVHDIERMTAQQQEGNTQSQAAAITAAARASDAKTSAKKRA
jgi:hypothetical protein